MIREAIGRLKVSERSACRAVGQPRSTQRYPAAQRRSAERALCGRMRELALRHPRYGYRRIWVLLREEGFEVNRKRVHRLWRKEGLKVYYALADRSVFTLCDLMCGRIEREIAARRGAFVG